MGRRRREIKWGFLDWLGLIVYIIAWMLVISSPAQAQGIPSTFVPVSPYHILLYTYLAMVGGLMYLISPAMGLLSFVILPARPQPIECPIYLRAWDGGPYMLTPSNASSVTNISYIQVVYAAPPGTRTARVCWTPLLLYTGPICCFLYQCEGAYQNPYPDVLALNLTDKMSARDIELMLLPSGEPMVYYKASYNNGSYDITCKGLVGEEVYLAILSATIAGIVWIVRKAWPIIRREREDDR